MRFGTVLPAASLLLLSARTPAFGCEDVAPWSNLGRSAGHFTEVTPLALAATGIVAPLAFAPTGGDHELRRFGQLELGGTPNLEPVSVWTPYVVPLVLIGVEAVAAPIQACEVMRPTSAMLQAFVLTLATTSTLKWVTGRSWPNAGRDPALPDRLQHPEFATRFDWFSWNRGHAWPSGHTATMMSVAAALATVTEHRLWWGYTGYALTFGVATGMYLGDHHWVSDIVSGGLIGFAIGHSVGTAFRPSTSEERASGVVIVPWVGAGAAGLDLTGSW